MGSLADNVRLGTLRRDFPRFLPGASGGPREDDWSRKTAVDLSCYRAAEETLTDPDVFLLFPRVEEGLGAFFLWPHPDDRLVTQSLFLNASEKLSQTTLLYDRVPVPGFDSAALAEERRIACWGLARHPTRVFSASVLSGPRECWGDLLERDFMKRR
jgi:hypothetical protein